MNTPECSQGASPEEGGCPFAHSPPRSLPSEFGNTVELGGRAGGGSQSILGWASVYPFGIHLPTRRSKTKEIGRFIPVAGEAAMVSGLKSVQEMRLPADADRPPPTPLFRSLFSW